MNRPMFRFARKGDRPSAKEHNRLTGEVARLAASAQMYGISSSMGLLTRTPPLAAKAKEADQVRLAFCDGAPTGKTIAAFLNVDTIGEPITVYTLVSQAAEYPNNTFDMNTVQPRLIDGAPIVVNKINGNWVCPTVFQPTVDCDCYSA